MSAWKQGLAVKLSESYSRGCVCEIGFSLLFDTLSSVQFAHTLILLRAILNLFKYEMCCVTRLALSGTPSTSWNSSKSFCKHMFTLLSVCICFLIRLIGHRGMLVIRSSVVQYRFDDLIGIGIILNFISPSIKSPITPHIIHPVFSAHLDFWQLNSNLVGDGEPSPAAEPWIEGDEKNCWSIVSMDTYCSKIHE